MYKVYPATVVIRHPNKSIIYFDCGLIQSLSRGLHLLLNPELLIGWFRPDVGDLRLLLTMHSIHMNNVREFQSSRGQEKTCNEGHAVMKGEVD